MVDFSWVSTNMKSTCINEYFVLDPSDNMLCDCMNRL